MNAKSILVLSVSALSLAVGLITESTAGGRHAAPAGLVGTWRVTVTPANCATGELFPAFAVPATIMFGPRGTAAEENANPRFQPGQRSGGLGFWERTGPGSYRALIEAFIQFTSVVTPPATPPYVRGRQRFEHGIQITDGDNWTSDASVTFFDASDTPLGTGCARTVAVRMD
jgi:hypothetical protein